MRGSPEDINMTFPISETEITRDKFLSQEFTEKLLEEIKIIDKTFSFRFSITQIEVSGNGNIRVYIEGKWWKK